VKGSALLSVISVYELTRAGQAVISVHFAPFEIYLLIALYYYVTISFLTRLSRWMEHNYRCGDMSKRVIEATQLTKSYGGRKVLDGMSLAVDEGDTVVIIGPPGLARRLSFGASAGLRFPDSGAIRLRGERVGIGEDGHTRPEKEVARQRSRIGSYFSVSISLYTSRPWTTWLSDPTGSSAWNGMPPGSAPRPSWPGFT